MTIAATRHLIMRPSKADRAHLAAIADHLQTAGAVPTVSAILRHALRIAAEAITPVSAPAAEATR